MADIKATSEADAASAVKDLASAAKSPSELEGVPGQLSSVPLPSSGIPEWYKVGWAAQMESAPDRDLMEVKHKALLETFLSEMYYGDWYAVSYFGILRRDLSGLTKEVLDVQVSQRSHHFLCCRSVSLCNHLWWRMGIPNVRDLLFGDPGQRKLKYLVQYHFERLCNVLSD